MFLKPNFLGRRDGEPLVELIGVVIAFGLMFTVVNRRKPLALAMLLGSVVIIGFSRLPLSSIIPVAKTAFFGRSSLELVVTVAAISLLARSMREYNLLERMTSALTAAVRSTRVALLAIPGLIGCLPVLGGAVLSAPMVDALGSKLDLPPTRKAAANLIFRHAWFFMFPFIPSLVLTANLAGVAVTDLIKHTAPLTAIALGTGYLLFFRGAPREQLPPMEPSAYRHNLGVFLLYSSPIVVSLLLYLVVGVLLPLALLVGVGVAMLIGSRERPVNWALLYQGLDWPMMAAMVGIVFFKGIISSVSVIPTVVASLVNWGIPSLALLFLLPLLIGFSSASQSTSVGITLPLLLPMLEPGQLMAGVTIVYVSSFLAYLMSPLHLCQALTNDYFGVALAPVCRDYLPVVLVILVSALGLYCLYL